MALLLLEAAPKPPGSAAGDFCATEMVWHGRVAWLPWALLLLWVPGEGLGRQLRWVGGEAVRGTAAGEAAVPQTSERGALCPAQTWTDGRAAPWRGQTRPRSST